MEKIIQSLSAIAPIDDIRYFIGNVLSFAFAFVFRFVHGEKKRMIVDFILTFIMLYISTGNWIFLTLMTVLISYPLLKIKFPTLKKHPSLDIRAITIATLNIGLIIVLQAALAITSRNGQTSPISDYWLGTQMIVSHKLGALAFRDMRKELTLPSLLVFIFDINGSLSGAAIEYKEWQDWIKEKYAVGFEQLKKKSLLVGFQQMGLFLLSLVVHIFLGPKVRASLPSDYPKNFQEWVYNVLSNVPKSIVMRAKYYAIWCMMYGICCISLFSVAPTANGEYALVRGKNIDILKVETGRTFTDITKNWNILSARWFRTYLYQPLVAHGLNKSLATLATNSVSAMWHGMSFGYHCFFFTAGWATICNRVGFKSFRIPLDRALNSYSTSDPECLKAKVLKVVSAIYAVLQVFMNQVVMANSAICFVLLYRSRVMAFLRGSLAISLWLPLVLAFLSKAVFARLLNLFLKQPTKLSRKTEQDNAKSALVNAPDGRQEVPLDMNQKAQQQNKLVGPGMDASKAKLD